MTYKTDFLVRIAAYYGLAIIVNATLFGYQGRHLLLYSLPTTLIALVLGLLFESLVDILKEKKNKIDFFRKTFLNLIQDKWFYYGILTGLALVAFLRLCKWLMQ